MVGDSIKGEGIHKEVSLEMLGVTMSQIFFLFELGSADVALGIAWLGTSGDVYSNWKMMTMSLFGWGGRSSFKEALLWSYLSKAMLKTI